MNSFLQKSSDDPGKSDKLRALPNDDHNFGTPLELIEGTVVPTELFFLRSNNPPPQIEPGEWRLQVDGLVQRPIELGLQELQRLPVQRQVCWLECAGNSRARFQPPTEGNQWTNEAISNAEFTGVSLASVLELAGGVRGGAVEVVTTGADADSFQRAMPVEAALRPEVLLVWEMNGQPIPQTNGGPVRLLVPGWGGIASVKWPRRIEVIDHPFEGYWNRQRYILVDEQGQELGPVREMPVKSVIAAPQAGAQVRRAVPFKVFGFAWSGYGPIARVEVSTDGGRSWADARLIREGGPLAWTRWEYTWTPDRAGTLGLASRATDEQGNVQPEQPRWNKFGYQMNGIEVRSVEVD